LFDILRFRKVITKSIVTLAEVSCAGKSQDKERDRTFYEFIKLKRQSFNKKFGNKKIWRILTCGFSK